MFSLHSLEADVRRRLVPLSVPVDVLIDEVVEGLALPPGARPA